MELVEYDPVVAVVVDLEAELVVEEELVLLIQVELDLVDCRQVVEFDKQVSTKIKKQ
jgi:hypothetical protein